MGPRWHIFMPFEEWVTGLGYRNVPGGAVPPRYVPVIKKSWVFIVIIRLAPK